MNINRLITILATIIVMGTFSFGQGNNKMTDYLHLPGPIEFDKKTYNLSWTSHPTGNYYKQEYIPAGQTPDKFKNMILVEVLTGNMKISDAAGSKLAELKKMKETNPHVYYETYDNPTTGEFMIDFLLTANAADGKINIAERNIYRYKQVVPRNGQSGIFLFGLSLRSYGEAASSFIAASKANKKTLVDQVARFKLPEIKISR